MPHVALARQLPRLGTAGWRPDLSGLAEPRLEGSIIGVIVRCRNSELSVDDLRTWQGVVLGRAVSTLRSVETQPLAWGFVMYSSLIFT